MIGYTCTKRLSLVGFLLSSIAIGIPSQAQDKVDPAVLRSAQDYCLQKGISIVADAFASCLSERIYTITKPAEEKVSQGVVDKTPPQQSENAVNVNPPPRYPANTEVYPEWYLDGKKDPDKWVWGTRPKADLLIETEPAGAIVDVAYTYNFTDYRRLKWGCKTPCLVQLPVMSSWSFKVRADGQKWYVASEVPEWRDGKITKIWKTLKPGKILLRTINGKEAAYTQIVAECLPVGKKIKIGSIQHTNCVAEKMNSLND